MTENKWENMEVEAGSGLARRLLGGIATNLVAPDFFNRKS